MCRKLIYTYTYTTHGSDDLHAAGRARHVHSPDVLQQVNPNYLLYWYF